MSCQPFDDWLLNDKPLNSEERRELTSHVRICRRCAALYETGFALRAARAIPPAPGFVARFEKRLAAQKAVERRKRLIGAVLLSLTGSGLFLLLVAPYVYAILSSPAEWLTAAAGSLVFVVTFLRATVEAFSVFAKIIPNILPPYAWMVFASALAGFCLLWTVSLWRVSRAPQGVSA